MQVHINAWLMFPFKITSKTTGESHVVVTDDNGQFSTSSDWASHKHNTNKGQISEDGVWFGTSEPDDSKGALPYDTYIIEELRCESNKGFKLIPPFEIVVSRNNHVIDLGTLTDEYEKKITIQTSAAGKDGEKTILAGKEITIVDTVKLDGLVKGTKYQLKGWQMVKEENASAAGKDGEKTILAGKEITIVDTVKLDGLVKGTKYQLKGWQMVKEENAELVIDGKRVENDYTFIADDEEMKVEIAYTFNASALGGKNLVTFEELYDLSNPKEPVKVAEHKDINDDGQTVFITERIINIHTTAADLDGNKEIQADKEVTIIDTVTLEGLEVGTKYQLKGWQMVKEENAELIIDGKRVEKDYTFIADKENMTVEIAFTFDASTLGGGWQMVKEENAELIIDGKRVEKDYTFIADKENMTVEIAFTFDASTLGGKQLVTFEELYDLSNPDEPKKVAEHKDIEDDGQTVTIKEIPEVPEKPEEPKTPEKPTYPTDSPKTGDNTNVMAFVVMLLTSAGMLGGTYLWKKYRKKED